MVSRSGKDSLRRNGGTARQHLSREVMGTIVHLGSGHGLASWFDNRWPVLTRNLRLPGAGRVTNAAEELAKAAASFDQPAIFAFRASRVAGTTPTANLTCPVRMTWQGCAAGWAGRQQVSAVLDVLASIPDASILPCHAQQSPTTFAANVSFGFSPGGCRDPVNRFLAKLGHEG